VQRLLKEKEAFSFNWKKSLLALVISIIADTLDFIGEPILGFPLIGDIPNAFVTGLLFIITRNKRSTAINLIKFIPVIGDFIPTYTISTLMWIHKETRKGKNTEYII
jgi:predicted membrane protein